MSQKDRGLRTRKPFSSNISTHLIEKFDQLAAQTRIPKSRLLDEAIEDLLRKHGISVERE